MSQYDIIAQVRELVERNCKSCEIATRLHLDISAVNQVITMLKL